MESARTTCIFNSVKTQENEIENRFGEFIQYLTLIKNFCFKDEKIIQKFSDCAKEQRKNFDFMKGEKLENCQKSALSDSVSLSPEGGIVYLDQMTKESTFYDYSIVPSVFVNEKLIRGELETDVTIGAICDAMETKIKGCEDIHLNMMGKRDYLFQFNEKNIKKKEKNDYKNSIVIFFAIFGLFIFIVIVARRQFAKDIELDLAHRVENSLNEYYKSGGELGELGGRRTVMEFTKADV